LFALAGAVELMPPLKETSVGEPGLNTEEGEKKGAGSGEREGVMFWEGMKKRRLIPRILTLKVTGGKVMKSSPTLKIYSNAAGGSGAGTSGLEVKGGAWTKISKFAAWTYGVALKKVF